MDQIDTRALSEFTKAIKDIKKGIALCNRDEDIESLIILAKACFYTGFNNISEIYKITSKIELSNPLCKEEDIKFCSIICVYNGREKEGLELLFNRCSLSDSLRDLLFIATVNKIAKRYTSSILDYKRVLDKSSDNEIIKIVHINLGKIYFNQSLYQESLSHFYNASQIDKRDDSLKIWIGKNYSALGDRIKARAIWGEVLASDQSNVEAKRLLGLM
ncbi:MAG: hypothetical protein SVZ03_15670 [Spirochaetota bacterium]|nr:hypothetical protein [Spirochaetota bacterium]